jgi:acetyl esterase/lipase
MNRRSKTPFLIIPLLLILGLPTSLRPQAGWMLGGRPVPGPLPPDPGAALPALDLRLDVVYGQAEGVPLKLDFAKPALCRGQRVPLVVFIHGGAWKAGDKGGGLTRADSRLFFQLGFAVASINYRLAPEFHFPAQVHDCKLAVRFLRARADEWGVDPDRIGIWGSSAGGHLVALLGTAGEAAGLEGPGLEGVSSRVAAVVDHFGPTDLRAHLAVGDEWARQTVTDFLGCDPAACPETARAASPVCHVTAGDPPIMMIHGDRDATVPYNQSEILAEELRLIGNACALIKVENAGHGFTPTPKGAVIEPSQLEINLLTVRHLARFLEPALRGDLDMSGRRDGADFRALLGALGTDGVGPGAFPAPPGWNPLADLVPDGRIDYLDALAFLKLGWD